MYHIVWSRGVCMYHIVETVVLASEDYELGCM